jgi:hypothetical protein
LVFPGVSGSKEKESTSLFFIHQEKKWGFVDQTGTMIIPPQFTFDKEEEGGFGFAHGLARVVAGDQWAYIERTGRFVWPPGQLQEPPSPPPGEVQPSLIKPPQKKENLSYEDRQAWLEILKWSEHCGPDTSDLRRPGVSLPPQNPSGLRFWQLEPKKYLVEVKCQAGAYNDLQLYLFYDETTTPPACRIVHFEKYDIKAKNIGAETETEVLGSMEFDPREQELTRFEMARGLGDCGAWFKYRINEDKGVLLEYRAKDCDDKEEFEGIPHPGTFPLLFRHHQTGVRK